MGAIIGAVLGIGGGVAGAYGIVAITRLGSCAGDCPEHLESLPFLIGGILAVVASAFFWRWAMAVAPVAGIITAGVLLVADGVEVLGDNTGFTAMIVLSVLAGPLILGAVGIWSVRRRAVTDRLVREGHRAVAEVLGAQPTGVVINHQPQLLVRYVIHPLDGTASFEYSQRRTTSFNEVVPRPGLRWPAWYRPGDTRKVAIGAPSGGPQDPITLGVLQQFGITVAQAFGYDPAAGAGVPGAPAFGTYGSSFNSPS